MSTPPNTSPPEFSVNAQDFNTIIQHERTAKLISTRINDLKSDLKSKKSGVDVACCPVHGEPMELHEKQNAIGLLDQYYLRCKYWSFEKTGGSYIEKLKSPSQLASLLNSQTGRGIM